jgi:hypothetical protein
MSSIKDPGGVLKASFDEATQSLRVNANITANISGAQEVVISHADDSIKIGDGVETVDVTAANALKVDGSAVTQPVSGTVTVQDGGGSVTVDGSVSVSNFPATQNVADGGGSLTVDGSVSISNFPAVQDVEGTVSVDNFPSVQPINDNGGSITVDGSVTVSNFPAVQPVSDNGGSITVDGTVNVGNFPATQPISAISLPLPTGAATETKQDTGNTSLSNIDGKLSAKVGGHLPTMQHGVYYSLGLGTYESVPIRTEAFGADVEGNEQAALWVYDKASSNTSGSTITSLTNGSGDVTLNPASTVGSSVFIDISGTWTGSMSVQMWPNVNAVTIPVRIAGTSTLVTSITANGIYLIEGHYNGLNLVNSIATGTADILAYAGANAQSGFYSYQAGDWNIEVPAQKSSTATLSNISASASSTSVLSSTPGRKGASFYNDSSADCFLKYGTSASATSFTVKLTPGSFASMDTPVYTGAITAIWTSATGTLRVTEMT